MCAGAVLQARLGEVVYGAPNPLMGAAGSWVQLLPAAVFSQQECGDEPRAAGSQHSLPGREEGELQRQDAAPVIRPSGHYPFHTEVQARRHRHLFTFAFRILRGSLRPW